MKIVEGKIQNSILRDFNPDLYILKGVMCIILRIFV